MSPLHSPGSPTPSAGTKSEVAHRWAHRVQACVFSKIGNFLFVESCVIFSAVNTCTKKSSSHVIFFCGNACDGHTQLTAKKITQLDDFFATRIYRKKKLHESQHTPPIHNAFGGPNNCAEKKWREGVKAGGNLMEGWMRSNTDLVEGCHRDQSTARQAACQLHHCICCRALEKTCGGMDRDCTGGLQGPNLHSESITHEENKRVVLRGCWGDGRPRGWEGDLGAGAEVGVAGYRQ